jgi:histone deacetylase complex regulatory component SIN3
VTPKEEHYYINFLSYAHNFLDTTMDAAAFEDAVRELYGIHAYIIFTIDKVVHACWKQVEIILFADI